MGNKRRGGEEKEKEKDGSVRVGSVSRVTAFDKRGGTQKKSQRGILGVCLRGWSGISQKMVNEREIISPLLYHHHHHSLSFLSSFSLIPIIFPNSSSLLTLIPFSNNDPLFLLPFSFLFFNRFFPCFLFPIFYFSLRFSIWVSLFSLLGFWVGRFLGGVVALSSPGNGVSSFMLFIGFLLFLGFGIWVC